MLNSFRPNVQPRFGIASDGFKSEIIIQKKTLRFLLFEEFSRALPPPHNRLVVGSSLLGPPLHYVRVEPVGLFQPARNAWAFTGSKQCFSKSRLTLLGPPFTSYPFWSHRCQRNKMHLPDPSWYRQPGRHLPACLFSQEANRQPQISKDATEKRVARTAADSRSGMSGYELLDQLSEQFFRPAGGYFANFSSSVGSISEEIYSRQVLYSSYTYRKIVLRHRFVVIAGRKRD